MWWGAIASLVLTWTGAVGAQALVGLVLAGIRANTG